MLNIEKLKKIDPKLNNLNQDEILEIRNSLYELGQTIFDDWLKNSVDSKYPAGVLQKLEENNKLKL